MSRAAVPLAVPLGGSANWWDLELLPDSAAGPGAPALVLVRAQDATQRLLDRRDAEAAEQALAIANARLGLAQEVAGVGPWEWTIPAGRIAWSPEQFRLHGMDPARAALIGAAPGGDPAATALDRARHGGARILVVEDEEAVRLVTARLLRELGYAVIEAANAGAAAAAAHVGAIDMLVTDVDLGGAPGPVLAARLRGEHPGLSVLYVTGHGDAATLDGAQMLRKPFDDAALARAVLRGLGRLAAAEAPGARADRLRRPEHRQAYLRWRQLRDAAPGALPAVQDFAPDDLPEALRDAGYLAALLPVLEDAAVGSAGFRFRHVGRLLQPRMDQPLAGRTLGAGAPADGTLAVALGGSVGGAYRRCARSRVPLRDSARIRLGAEGEAWLERLLLPLSADGVQVTHLFGIVLVADGPAVQDRGEGDRCAKAAPHGRNHWARPRHAGARRSGRAAGTGADRRAALWLDPAGGVTWYGASERRESGLRRDALGRLFFTEIAPCMDNPDVRGRIERARAAGRLDLAFGYVSDLPGGAQEMELHVRVQSAADGGTWIFLLRVP